MEDSFDVDELPQEQQSGNSPVLTSGPICNEDGDYKSNKTIGDAELMLTSLDAASNTKYALLPECFDSDNPTDRSARHSTVIQHVQLQSASVHGTLQQSFSIDGSTEPRVLVTKKGRFTVTHDTQPTTPKIVDRSGSLAGLQTTPTTVQKGRFTVIPDSESASQANVAQENAPTAPTMLLAPTPPPKVEKKGRFVVTTAIPSGLYVDSDILLPQTFDRSSTLPIHVAPAPPSIYDSLSQQLPAVVSSDPTGVSDNKTGIANGGLPRVVHASFDTIGVGSTQGVGKVLYYLDQIKADVIEADRSKQVLQNEINVLKEKNKELEARSREMERLWKEQKAFRESAETKVRVMMERLRDHDLREKEASANGVNGKSSRSSSIGDKEEGMNTKKNGCVIDSAFDALEKCRRMDSSPKSEQLGSQSARRPSNDKSTQEMSELCHESASVTNFLYMAKSVSQQAFEAANSSGPCGFASGDTCNQTDGGSQHCVTLTSKRQESICETTMLASSVNSLSIRSSDANATNPDLNQLSQHIWNQGQAPLQLQQQFLQKPPLMPVHGGGISHHLKGPQQNDTSQVPRKHAMPSPDSHQKMAAQQQQLGMPALTPQPSVPTTQPLPKLQTPHCLPMFSQKEFLPLPVKAHQVMLSHQRSFLSQQKSQTNHTHVTLHHPQTLQQDFDGMNPFMNYDQSISLIPQQPEQLVQNQPMLLPNQIQQAAPKQHPPVMQSQVLTLPHHHSQEKSLSSEQLVSNLQQQQSMQLSALNGCEWS